MKFDHVQNGENKWMGIRMKRKIKEYPKKLLIKEDTLETKEANNFFPITCHFYVMPRVCFREFCFQELWVNVKSKGDNI